MVSTMSPNMCKLCPRSIHPDGEVRVFYQSELGFEPTRFADLDISANKLSVEDVDEDGYTDIVVRTADGKVAIHWGGPDGIDPNRSTVLDVPLDELALSAEEQRREMLHSEYNQDAPPLIRVVRIGDKPHVFVARHRSAHLAPVNQDRSVGEPIVLHCARAMAVTVGDIDGDGHEDVVVACREHYGDAECSWVYWGGDSGFGESRRTRLERNRACDVVIDDFDGDRLDDIVLCQDHTSESFTADSLIYRGARDRELTNPTTISAEDPTHVFIIKAPEREDRTFCSSTTTAGRSSRLTQRSSTAGSMASRRNGARMFSAAVPAASSMLSTSWRTPRPASRWLISRACTVVGSTVSVLRSPTSTATGPVFGVWCPGLLNGDSTPRECRGQATWNRRQAVLTEQQKHEFETFGFLLLKDFIPSDEMQPYVDAFDGTMTKANGGVPWQHAPQTHAISPFYRHNPAVYHRLLDHDKISEVVEDLLGEDFTFWHAEGRHWWSGTEWHHDSVAPEGQAHLKVVFFLDPVSANTG